MNVTVNGLTLRIDSLSIFAVVAAIHVLSGKAGRS